MIDTIERNQCIHQSFNDIFSVVVVVVDDEIVDVFVAVRDALSVFLLSDSILVNN